MMKSPSQPSSAAKALACVLFASLASTPAGFAESPKASVSGTKIEWRADLSSALADAAKNEKERRRI